MSKAKQIWAILFPHGFWHTYIPAWIILAMQFWLAFFNRSVGAPDWTLALNCICICFGLHSIYKTYRFRVWMRAEEKLMRAVLETVRPQLEALHTEAIKNKEFDNAALVRLSDQSFKIIDAEFERRRNLARVPKTDKP